MLDENRVEQIVSELCESYVRKRKGGFNARCPVCGDSQKTKRKRRLHIDWYQKHNDWAITCYNGGCPFRSGNLYSLYAYVRGVEYSEARRYINQDTYNTEEIKERLSNTFKPKKPDAYDDKGDDLDLDMDDCLTFNTKSLDRIHLRYKLFLRTFMLSRHIRKPCFIAHSGRYKNRIIIPIYEGGKMVYFQGRAMNSTMDPKYLNPIVDKTDIVMNRENFSRNKCIMVTEGIIDAWMVEDDQGTSVLGGYFDEEKITQLLTMTDKDVILCFDNPLIDKSGSDEILRFIEESTFTNKVKFFLPDRKDFKDLNELKGIYSDSIYEYIVNNSFTALNIKVKLSLLYK